MNPIPGVPQPAGRNRFALNVALVALAGLCFAFSTPAQAAAPGEDFTFFESKVRPLLAERCYECHGEKKQKGGLRLDSKSGWQKGGDTGPALLPGKPEESLIIKAVRRHDPDLQMPPKTELIKSEVETLIAWVKSGAPDPRETAVTKRVVGMSLEEGRKHWAFQPLAQPKPPKIKHSAWPHGAIDRFVLEKLEAHQLKPVADADCYTWLRRVTFDLTGLPPTAQEIAAFVGDHSSKARERVVDRLLASPAFGECWARHWLDLVGYADQLGTVNDVPARYAWRYRDYVIRACNTDKPFDQFMREQVAGDLLPAASIEAKQDALTATGFLLLGEIHIVTSDKLQLRADIVDHQIQKVGLAFLGQTLGCVRCHDHKFDPIHLSDYYGLAGIFGSTESAYVTGRGVWSSLYASELPESPVQLVERERLLREHNDTVARLKAERADFASQVAAIKPPATNAPPAVPPVDWKARKSELEKKISGIDSKLLHLGFIEPKAALAYCVHDATNPSDGRITIRGNAHAPGDTVPRGFVRVVNRAPWPQISTNTSGRVQLADWLASTNNPLPARVTVNRIWEKIFGEGLVRSVDYFGTRGDKPSHPELLDWLAQEFIRNGWSQKRLIREIVLSRAYGLSSVADAATTSADPDNRWFGRANRRRLDAEALRDTILAVSDELVPCKGGPALALQLRENVGGLDPKDPNPVSFSTSKFPEEQHHQRTIYLPVVRSRAQPGPAELRNLFDFVPPTEMAGHRPVTSVPTQALYLLNSEFVKSHAGKLADWVLKQNAPNDHARLELLYLRTLNRPANQTEIGEGIRFLTDPDSVKQRAAWTAYCHALLTSNEFLFRL